MAVPTPGEDRRTEDRFVLRREAEAQVESHERIHQREKDAIDLALEVTERDRKTHDGFHEREHVAHTESHKKEALQVDIALAAVAREREIHAEAHDREHEAHQREHALDKLAISKAEQSTDKLFAAMNESIETFRRDTDRRINEMRDSGDKQHNELRVSITNLEKGDVKSEGKGLGQSQLVGYIALGISLIVGIFTIIAYLAAALRPEQAV